MSKNDMFGNIIIVKRTHRYQNMVLENPVILLEVPFLPTTLSFSVYGTIFTERNQEKYSLRVIIKDQTGFEVLNTEGDVFDTNKNREFSILDLNIDVDGSIFKSAGKHICQLFVDNEIMDEYEFFINNLNVNLEGERK